MQWILGAIALVVCAGTCVLIARRARSRYDSGPLADRAQSQFHGQREWLEVAFLGAHGRTAPADRARWEDAHWGDEVLWARDRQTSRLLALVGVEFEPESPFEAPGNATVVFEYHYGRWNTDGKHLDSVRPEEAILLRQGRYERLALPEGGPY